MWWIILAGFLFCRPVMAAELAEVVIRPERTKAGASPLPILVTVMTGNGEIESSGRITVGAGWNVGEVSISTERLPEGVSAWPGLNITGVAGKQINFESNDLSGSTSYGFYIESGITNNPIGSMEADRKWKVKAGSAEKEVKVLVAENDQITVTGKVGAKATDFQLEAEVSPEGSVNQNQEIDVVIRYGSYLLSHVRPMVVTLEWSRGTIEGQPMATVDVLNYVIGSAGKAFGEAQPVIDPVNRKISWTISSFPGETTGKEISLKLKTTENYKGGAGVNFWIKARLQGAGVVTVDTRKDRQYRYYKSESETQSLTTPVPGSTTDNYRAEPTIVRERENVRIEGIKIVTVGKEGVSIVVNSGAAPENVKVRFGETISGLKNSVVSLNGTIRDMIDLDGLTPGRAYFFTVEVTGSTGEKVQSDIYTFRTPEVAGSTKADSTSVVVSSQNNIVTDARSEETEDFAKVVLPYGNVYSVKVNFSNPDEIKEAVVLVRNASVLGAISVYGAEPSTVENVMVGTDKKGYVGQLVSPREPGYYEIYVRVNDVYGGVREQKIADFRVIDPIKIIGLNGTGLEGVKVFLTKFDDKLNLYKPLPSQYEGIINPSYTDSNGEVNIALPKGSYRAEISMDGYESESADFRVGMNIDDKMPSIKLKKSTVRLGSFVNYYVKTADDISMVFRKHWANLVTSKRFFNFFGLVVIVISVGLTAGYLAETYRLIRIKSKPNFWEFLGKELTEAVTGGVLLISCLIEMLFLRFIGWEKVWPFLILSMFNLVMWVKNLMKLENYEK